MRTTLETSGKGRVVIHTGIRPKRVLLMFLLIMMASAASFAATPIGICGFNITTPGSYIVTTDLTCGGVGILVAASNVDLNLNGHFIASAAGNDVGIITATQDPEIPGTPQLNFSACTKVSGVRIHDGIVNQFNQNIVICSPNAQNSGPSITMGVEVNRMQMLSGANGVTVLSSGGNTIDDNFISGTSNLGIDLEFSASNTVGKNMLDGNYDGIRLNESNRNFVIVNSISNNFGVGLAVFYSANNVVSNNFFSDTGDQGLSVGLQIGLGATGTNSTGNIAFESRIADLLDFTACGVNTWTNNFFGSSLGGCIH